MSYSSEPLQRVLSSPRFSPIGGFFMTATSLSAPSDLVEEIAAGDVLTFSAIAREQGDAPSTVFRWAFRGIPGAGGGRVRLEAIRRGRAWVTSRKALERFLAALPASGSRPAYLPPSREPRQQRQDERAASEREAASQRARESLRERHGF